MGSAKPEADAEIVLLTNNLMKSLGLHGYAFKIGHIGVIRGILSQDGVDEKTQNAVLQRMDKKEYDAALKLVESEKCRAMLEGLIDIRGNDWLDTVEQLQTYVANYEKAKAAVENLAEVLKLVTESADVSIAVEPAFARGLEYYTGMIFEIYIPDSRLLWAAADDTTNSLKPSAANPLQQSVAPTESTASPSPCKHRKPPFLQK